jgi:hypothetical protein
MSYSDAIVAQAKLWVGYEEGAANANLFSAGLGRPGEPWCQDFIQFISAAAGFRQPIETGGVVAIGECAKRAKIFIESTKATAGCQILYDFSKGNGQQPADPMKTHTGLYLGDGLTIQGNTDVPGFVHKKPVTLGAADIWGAINWPAYWATRPVPFSQATGRFPHYPVLGQNGHVDDRVLGLQRALNDVLGIKLVVDGQFGTNTVDACRQFQRASRIPVTGVADQQTWACLDIALDKLTK